MSRINRALGCGLALALLTPAVAQADRSLSAERLRADALTDPLGIADAAPKLSWELSSRATDAQQTAYQVRVVVDGRLAWDSGRVRSTVPSARYAGRPLGSRSDADWQVRVWDGRNRPSDWSRPASFETGLLNSQDWSA